MPLALWDAGLPACVDGAGAPFVGMLWDRVHAHRNPWRHRMRGGIRRLRDILIPGEGDG
jgi:hypothetical protein